jgi:hypothetical protein
MLDLLLDSFMALLLLFTMFFCWKLNGRIRVLQDSKEELAETIREFDACTQRAAQSIAEIHTATQRISENIQHKIDKAHFIADDLEIMISRGKKMTSGTSEPRPKASIRSTNPRREAPKAEPAQAEPRKPKAAFVDTPEVSRPAAESLKKRQPERAGRTPSRAERELMDAVKNVSDETV